MLSVAREHFKSKVEHERLDVHRLDPGRIGTFDLVFCAGVLYHLRHPLLALEKIRSVTEGQCILETHQLIMGLHESVPVITSFRVMAVTTFTRTAHFLQALAAAGLARNEVVDSTTSRLKRR